MALTFDPNAQITRGGLHQGTKLVVFYGVKSVAEDVPFTCSIATFKGWFAKKYNLDTTTNIRIYSAE